MMLFSKRSALGLVGVGLCAMSASGQEIPDCGDTIEICVTKAMAEALGLCPESIDGCLSQLCDGELGPSECCSVFIDIDGPPGCPSDPEKPCPVGAAELIDRLADEVAWDPMTPEANQESALLKLCSYLGSCCASASGMDGITRDDAILAFRYLFPDSFSELSDDDLNQFFDSCAGGSDCPGKPEPPTGPPVVDPDDWPNPGIPGDGPPRDPDLPGSPNRGGRCTGNLLSGSPDFESFSNDPAECAGGSSMGIFDIDLFSGRWAKQSVDLALPAEGFSWVVGRSYNGAQQMSDAGDYVFVHSNGMQGYNWRQDSLPTLVWESGSDAIYLVLNFQSYIAFGRVEDGNSSLWIPTGSKGGAIVRTSHTSGSDTIHTFEVHDLSGLKMTFFGFETYIEATKRGQIWKIEDPDSNVAYVGHATDPFTALSTGFVEVGTSTGIYAVESVYDTSGRLHKYAYSADPIDEDPVDGAHRLISVTAYPSTSEMDPFVAKVEYEYYDYDPITTLPEPFGLPGDLKLVRVTTPTSVSGEYIVERTHYRYWVDDEDGDDPDMLKDGYDHAIKYIYNSEGLRRADIEISGLDDDPTTDDVLDEDLTDLKPYAAQYMEYNDTDYDRRVKLVWGNGECGCGSASGPGVHGLSYESYVGFNIMDPGEPTWQPWYTRTIIQYPEAAASEPTSVTLEKWETHYFGLGGSKVATVVTDGDPTETSPAPDAWVTLTEFDYADLGALQYTPAAISAYDHSTGEFTKGTSGLVYEYIPWDLDDVGGGIDTRNAGRTRYITWKNGSTFGDYLSETEQEFREVTVTAGGGSTKLVKPYTKRARRYPEGGTTVYEQTLVERTYHTGTLRVATEIIKQPEVPTGENGNGTGDYDPVTTYYRKDGTVSWVVEADGILSYTKYLHGVPVLSVSDADTSGTGVVGEDQTGAPSETGTPLHIATVYDYDPQKRMTVMTLPHGRKLYEHYDVLENGLIVNLSFPEATATTVSGPASFSLSGHNGAVYQSGTIAMASADDIANKADWVDEEEEDAFDAFDDLSDHPARLTETIYDEPGDKVTATRVYYDTDSTGGLGYDETTYAYDDMGRVVRMEAPHGTVTRTRYDDLGRSVKQWMGTDDTGFPDGSGSSSNMTKISETVYDGGGVGNGLVSLTKAYTDDSTSRDTSYLYDARNRLIVQLNPLAPHTVYEYDNLDRVIYTAMYNSSSGLAATTVASATATTRVSLSQTNYDTRGRVYESRTYEVVQGTGALANSGNNYLFNKTWYSDVGQVIKTTGRSLTKTTYDRLRRPIAMYALSSTNDSVYADADDVTGDTVVSESHTLWDNSSGLAMAAMRIDRHPEDTTTTGPLFYPLPTTSVWDEEDIAGRVQISAMWYDEQDRMIESVDYGTKGFTAGSSTESFDRFDTAYDSPPTPTALIGTTEIGHFVIQEYNDDGEVEVVSVPNDDSDDWVVLTKSVYDDAGRVVQRIENWDENPSPTPSLPDVNRITELRYEDGLLKFQFAKNAKDGPSVETQATRYVYGTTKGMSSSDVATGHLLQTVHYPDATEPNGDISSGHNNDSMVYLYNAQGQRKATKDQAGNVIAMEFDGRGRVTSRRATTIVSGFDEYVNKIATEYDLRGLVISVKQYGDTGSTALRDQVEFTYDDWGNLETSDQDPDGSSSFAVDYQHALSSGEISTLRRTRIDYPGTARVDYVYNTGMDANLSRVTKVKFDPVSISPEIPFAVDIAQYTYGGAANLLKTTVFGGGQTFHTAYYDTSDADGYLYLDDFNRPKQSYWAHGTATSGMKFFEADLFYDKASNITDIDDQVTGRNMVLTVDDFRRLTQSDVGSDTESWAYDHLGNWQTYEYNNGDMDYDRPLEVLDARLFNRANEMTSRDISLGVFPQTPVAQDPSYDEAGNMTDDGRYYEYTYDAFGRITQVDDVTGTPVTVAEYRYNGLFQRTVTKTDRDGSSGLSGEDEYYHVYDDRWRVIEIWRKASGGSLDSYPKEVTLYHAAGVGGSSSPLDSVIARYRSDEGSTSGTPYDDWGEPATGTMDKRSTYFQNWRGDVVFVRGHETTERIDYTPYGIPMGYVGADQDRSGSVTAGDYAVWSTNLSAGSPLADVDFNGTLNSMADGTAWGTEYTLTGGTVGGAHVLSPWADNHIGYAGYRLTDQTQTAVWHVRFREFVPELGVWTRRDPIGYHDGYDLYEYVRSNSVMGIDPMGLACGPCGCGKSCGGGGGSGGSAAPSTTRASADDVSSDALWPPCGTSYREIPCRSWAARAMSKLGLYRVISKQCRHEMIEAASRCCAGVNCSGHTQKSVRSAIERCLKAGSNAALDCHTKVPCNQTTFDCWLNCLQRYDPVNYIPAVPAPAIQTPMLPFMPVPKTWWWWFQDWCPYMLPAKRIRGPGISPITTIPSGISAGCHLGGRSRLRAIGRGGWHWILVPYGTYLAGVELSCYLTCVGDPCAY